MVVADTPHAAEDGAERVVVDYESGPAVSSIEAAIADDAPRVHDEGNVLLDTAFHDDPALDELLEDAALVLEESFASARLSAVPLEGRACLAEWDDRDQRLTLWTSTQVPHLVRTTVAALLRLPEHRLRVIAPDVGGGFGQKCVVAREEALTCIAARRLGAPGEVGRGPPGEPRRRLPGPRAALPHPRRLRRRGPAARSRGRHPVRRRRLLDPPVHLRGRAADGRHRAARALRGPPLPGADARGGHEQVPDGALPRRVAPADGARDGAADAEGRAAPRPRPGRDPAAQPDPARRVPVDRAGRPGHRPRQLPRGARDLRRDAGHRRVPRAPERRARRRPPARARPRVLRRAQRLRDRGVQPAQDDGDAGLRHRPGAHGPLGRRDASTWAPPATARAT